MRGHVMAIVHRERGLRHRLGGYREYDSAPRFDGWIEALWTYRAPTALVYTDASTHRVLPDPAVSVAFCCGRHADGSPRDARLVVIGPTLRPAIHRYQPGSEIAAVKLKLEWAAPLLDLVPTDHLDTVHDLAQVHPQLAGRLFDSLVATRTIEQALDALSAGIVQATHWRRDHASADSAVAFDLVRNTAGRLPIERIAGLTGVSLRHLRRTARQDSGIPLKVYARMVRLVQTVTTIDRLPMGTPIEWARVAIHAGYCDQPHLIRECRAISGLSPSELIRERRGEVDPDAGTRFTPTAAPAICSGSPITTDPGTRHAHRSLPDGADAVSLRE
jgi:AraC-like DNA-binding protein